MKAGYLADDIIAAEPVLIHDGDDDGGLPQHMGGHIEGEGLVEDGIQAALHRHRLLLLNALVLVHQPHLHIWICNVCADGAQQFTRGRRCSRKVIFRVGFVITLLIVQVRKGSKEADSQFELKVNLSPELGNIQMRKYLWK